MSTSWLLLCVAVAVQQHAAATPTALVEPAWDMDMLGLAKQFCIQPTNTSSPSPVDQTPPRGGGFHRRLLFSPPPPLLPGPRLAWVAQPEGKPPPAGWPLYFQFVTDGYSSADGTQCVPPNTGRAGHKSYGAFDTPPRALAPCLSTLNGSTHEDFNCSFDQLSGALWDQRIKQYLLSNGVAVLQLNPAESDSWDAGPASASGDFQGWPNGPDHATFQSAFGMLKAGTMGDFDLSKVVFHGWSSGAQMVSWMAQLEGTGELAKLGGGAGVRMAGGVYVSGGSYTCYPDKGWKGGGVCAACNASTSCAGGGWFENAGCSTCLTNCGDFNRTGPPCCSKCCPDNFTESYYDSKAKYKKHPPAFLAQGATKDENADLCACKNYHQTLQANGVQSTLVLQPGTFEGCSCIGQPDDPSAAGSPFGKFCKPHTPPPSDQCAASAADPSRCSFCHSHVMAFSKMVVPLAEWVVQTVGAVRI